MSMLNLVAQIQETAKTFLKTYFRNEVRLSYPIMKFKYCYIICYNNADNTLMGNRPILVDTSRQEIFHIIGSPFYYLSFYVKKYDEERKSGNLVSFQRIFVEQYFPPLDIPIDCEVKLNQYLSVESKKKNTKLVLHEEILVFDYGFIFSINTPDYVGEGKEKTGIEGICPIIYDIETESLYLLSYNLFSFFSIINIKHKLSNYANFMFYHDNSLEYDFRLLIQKFTECKENNHLHKFKKLL